ncbi:MAG: DivIVA domain-containing protein [Bacteroidetes bacterium]|nr:DivIVA domain-containing protein [Bacteroidota bacterium]MDA1119715.1 DivIVA domain-containing protein [Bacteroidota bacterium]
MKITPIEIRQKQFEKKLRGFDKDEVNAFLTSMSQEWERVLDECKALKIKLEASEKEVQKLREVESSLFKTLKTAEDTGANMINQANKSAELHLKEAQINAESLMNDAKYKARATIEKAELETREIVEQMEDEVKMLEQNFKALENQKENLLNDLQNLTQDITDKLERIAKKNVDVNIDSQLKRAREFTRQKEEDFESSSVKRDPGKKSPVEISRPMRSAESPVKKVIAAQSENASQTEEPKEETRFESPETREDKKVEGDSSGNKSFFDDL